MNKKAITLISLTSVLATAATFLSAAGPKNKEEGKFHLVYLVAAVDLKPGSKVTVDPVFFTDGKTVKNFHLFCRQGMHSLKLSQVAADRQFIENYCSRKSFTLDPRGFHILNNHGQQLTLESIEFKVIGEFTHTGAAGHPIIPSKDKVMMGHTQARSYTPGTVEPPKVAAQRRCPGIFLSHVAGQTNSGEDRPRIPRHPGGSRGPDPAGGGVFEDCQRQSLGWTYQLARA